MVSRGIERVNIVLISVPVEDGIQQRGRVFSYLIYLTTSNLFLAPYLNSLGNQMSEMFLFGGPMPESFINGQSSSCLIVLPLPKHLRRDTGRSRPAVGEHERYSRDERRERKRGGNRKRAWHHS